MKNIKYILSAIILLGVLSQSCQQSKSNDTNGVVTSSVVAGPMEFFHGSWEEAKQQAINEDKLIFIDFYTQWCGPCFMMAEDVFPLEEVGAFYNSHFVNLKIDAEKGEGKELASKYKAKSFPTFAFIDPATEEVVHYSGSRQEAETFLFTGRSAIDPKKTSIYLNSEFKKGNKSPEFLFNYAEFMGSRYKRKELNETLNLLSEQGIGLDDERVWNMFVRLVKKRDAALSQELFKNTEKYIKLYGAEVVGKKLYSLLNYCYDEKLMNSVPDFHGKSFLMKKNRIAYLELNKRYKEAAVIIDELMVDPGEFKQEFCDMLLQTVRFAYSQRQSDFWMEKCMVYAQYLAYNYPDRKNGMAHYYYALYLEEIVRTMPNAADYFPNEIYKGPEHGVDMYSMRSPKLKLKPGTKRRR